VRLNSAQIRAHTGNIFSKDDLFFDMPGVLTADGRDTLRRGRTVAKGASHHCLHCGPTGARLIDRQEQKPIGMNVAGRRFPIERCSAPRAVRACTPRTLPTQRLCHAVSRSGISRDLSITPGIDVEFLMRSPIALLASDRQGKANCKASHVVTGVLSPSTSAGSECQIAHQ
jgi:hypothetical protein